MDHADHQSHADIAIDGAHCRIAGHRQAGRWIEDRTVFDIPAFLGANECHPEKLKDKWRGTYSRKGQTFTITSVCGFDVQARCDGKDIKAECKGGPLQPVKGRSAAASLTFAIGPVIVSGSNAQSEELWVAVPDSPTFEKAVDGLLKVVLLPTQESESRLSARTECGFCTNG